MNFSALEYPYPSRRSVVFSKNGMIATSQTLAAQAGLQILHQGSNAVDAAVATAACLTVVEPTSNGIGGDACALVWLKEKLYGLNSSGPAPTATSCRTSPDSALTIRRLSLACAATKISPSCGS